MKLLVLAALVLIVLAGSSILIGTSGAIVDVQATQNWDGGFIARPPHFLLDSSFKPTVADTTGTVGGVPFCFSASRGTVLCYTPTFIKKAYDFPTKYDGTGQTIVIVDAYGSPSIQADLNQFDTVMGLPAFRIQKLCPPTWTGLATDHCPTINLSDPNQVGWAEETTLDVTMAHALALGARIILVVAQTNQDPDINSAELAVVAQASLKGSIMSQSFGEPDDLVGCLNFPCTTRDPTIKATADKIYNTAVSNSWTVLASTGDDGANEAYSAVGTSELTPSWPATNPYNLAVGGSQGLPYGGQYGGPPGSGGVFTCAAGATCPTGLVTLSGGTNGCQTATRPGLPTGCRPLSYGGEGTWQEYNFFGARSSSGGGVSSLYPVPKYQTSLPASFPTLPSGSVPSTGRLTPDVSFNAAIQGGWLCYLGFFGVWGVFGGTSASTPAWAAIIALLNQAKGGPVGFVTPAIYSLAEGSQYSTVFHDITVGNNTDVLPPTPSFQGFSASPGYDLTTGWGTPDVTKFIMAMTS